jgi:hypothetical protein
MSGQSRDAGAEKLAGFGVWDAFCGQNGTNRQIKNENMTTTLDCLIEAVALFE